MGVRLIFKHAAHLQRHRTERGFSANFEAMLTRPFVIHYYDIAYFGEGIAARQRTQP